MIEKRLQFKGCDDNGNIFCQPLLGDGLEKTASVSGNSKLHPKVKDFVRAIKPTPHGIYILVSALGAGEFWGSNSNGDLFPEAALIHSPPDWEKLSITEMESIGKRWDYGYPTFMGAHPFKHHANKDAKKAFGSVELAVWNPEMHRVELVVYLDRALCKKFDAYDVIERIENGEFPDVSMGCLPKYAKILLKSGRRVAIEEIKKGDEVITHKGRAQKVTSTMMRPHKGSIYTVKAYGMREPLVLTEEHPLWLVRKEQVECTPSSKSLNKGRKQHICTPTSFLNKKGCSGCSTRPSYRFDWVRTDEAREGDYLATPLPVFESSLKLGASEARILGYYLSEGSLAYNVKGLPRAVTFSTGLHEIETHAELYQLAASLGVEDKVSYWDMVERNGRYITINDVRLATLCNEHCGSGAKEKSLSSELMGVNTDTLKLFLGSYANGDGGAYEGSLYLSTASVELSEQLRLVLARCGMIASVNKIFHKPSKTSVVQKDTIEYQVWVGTDTVSLLTTSRLSLNSSQKQSSKRFFYEYEGTVYLMTPIKSIEETPYDSDVYNFSVEEDESYVAEGLAVHNCRVPYDVCTICEHKSKTREDYCTHAAHMMNVILPDGRKVAVRNDFPRFFDISFVFIGAEKAAKVMAKLAQKGEQVCMADFCTMPGPAMVKVANDPINKKMEVRGVPLWIEWPKGSTRQYKDKKTGKVKYKCRMEADYGYIPGTKDADGEELDAYVGPNHKASIAYVIDQMLRNGKFDEHKVMIGFSSKEEAKACYEYHMGGAKERLGSIKGVLVSALKTLFAANVESAKEKTAHDCCCGGICDPCASLEKQAEALPKKTASHQKLSEITKIIPAGPFSKETLPRLERTEKDIPDSLIDTMSEHGLGSVLSTIGMMGMVMKPREFQRMLLIHIGERPLADDLDKEHRVFSPSNEVDDSIPIEKDLVDEDLKKLLMGMIGERSVATPALRKRTLRIALIVGKPSFKGEDSDEPIMKKIAAAYNGYRSNLIEKATQIREMLVTDSRLCSSLYGRSMAEAFAGGVEKTASADVLCPQSFAYLVGAYQNPDVPLSKEAVISLAQMGAFSEAAA